MNDRIKNILSQLQNEFIQKLMESQAKEEEIREKLQIVQEKIIDKVKSNCKQYVEWFDKFTKAVETPQGTRYELTDPKKQNEFNKFSKEYQQCINKYQSGIDKAVKSSEMESKAIQRVHDDCIKKCIDNSTNSDEEIKGCIRGCFNSATNEMERIWLDLDMKINETLVNMRKI